MPNPKSKKAASKSAKVQNPKKGKTMQQVDAMSFASYMHRRRLELSLQRGMLLAQEEFYAHITSRLTGHEEYERLTPSLFTMRQYENGARIPNRKKQEAIRYALGPCTSA